MRPQTIGCIVCAAFSVLPALAQAPLGSEITYQARIKLSGTPLNNSADFEFRLFDALSGGAQVGATQPINNLNVVDGQINVALNFGAAAFNGDQRFLEIALRSPAGSGTFTTLAPRQPLTAVPYALYALSGPGSGGPWAVSGNNIFNTNTGNVGIGTTGPTHSLHVRASIPILNIQDSDSTGAQQAGYVRFADSANTERGYVGFGSQLDTDLHLWNFYADGKTFVRAGPGAAGGILTLTPDGLAGIGTATPTQKLHVAGGAIMAQNSGDQADVLWLATDRSWVFRQQDTGAATSLKLQSIGGGGNKNFLIQTDGFVGIGTLNPQAKLDVNGTVRAKIVEITGADLAERFPSADERVEPGTVMEIDPQNPGKLRVARGAYNRRVAGVVSGANDFATGAILGNQPGHEDAPPIALSGRVYVWCDASSGAIEPGDLLTTSDTSGHAMTASDRERSHGAVIGKAMGRLESGRGLVLVLVNLQ
jgi:hypothetical protein